MNALEIAPSWGNEKINAGYKLAWGMKGFLKQTIKAIKALEYKAAQL